MAKITITIEDLANGNVSVKAEPNFETMMKMDVSGHGLTSAHGYAILALNSIRNESKNKDPRNRILVPSVRRH
jgi:hypothetical protein